MAIIFIIISKSMKTYLQLLFLFIIFQKGFTQSVTISPNNSNSSIVEINSTNKLFVPPRMTYAQIKAIQNPIKGGMVFNIDSNSLMYFDGGNWRILQSIIDPAVKNTWELLIDGSKIDKNLVEFGNFKPFAFDRNNSYLFTINATNHWLIRYDLLLKKVDTLSITNWNIIPTRLDDLLFDSDNNRIIVCRSGRDNLFAVSANGGAWIQIGNGNFDAESYGSTKFWNPLSDQVGFFGGYGFSSMKNWVYSNNGNWQLILDNTSNCSPPKGGSLLASNESGLKLFKFGGAGNCSGTQYEFNCPSGSGWIVNGNTSGYCWLRDLWEFDLSNNTFRNILPMYSSGIPYEGALSYDYSTSTFYLVGGFKPNQNDYVLVNKIYKFKEGVDTEFIEIPQNASFPPSPNTNYGNGTAYYDDSNRRIIWARLDGIWAFNL